MASAGAREASTAHVRRHVPRGARTPLERERKDIRTDCFLCGSKRHPTSGRLSCPRATSCSAPFHHGHDAAAREARGNVCSRAAPGSVTATSIRRTCKQGVAADSTVTALLQAGEFNCTTAAAHACAVVTTAPLPQPELCDAGRLPAMHNKAPPSRGLPAPAHVANTGIAHARACYHCAAPGLPSHTTRTWSEHDEHGSSTTPSRASAAVSTYTPPQRHGWAHAPSA